MNAPKPLFSSFVELIVCLIAFRERAKFIGNLIRPIVLSFGLDMVRRNKVYVDLCEDKYLMNLKKLRFNYLRKLDGLLVDLKDFQIAKINRIFSKDIRKVFEHSPEGPSKLTGFYSLFRRLFVFTRILLFFFSKNMKY
ncbi:hypothetical protein BpHYR1_033792 [Brachionus plicatilis]|uniref:Uncharacterized protein n=1 Tax=Brachionus plicatilis TaxID=10195 RepID=A0A3M7Q795_BRAPC|nr:hypothetical protein BpHYR1_033792 [Brachionus plicatilis]